MSQNKLISTFTHQFAQALDLLHQLHEASWVDSDDLAIHGKYTREVEDCAREACRTVGLDEVMYVPLYILYGTGYCEVDLWQQDILAGRTDEILNPASTHGEKAKESP